MKEPERPPACDARSPIVARFTIPEIVLLIREKQVQAVFVDAHLVSRINSFDTGNPGTAAQSSAQS